MHIAYSLSPACTMNALHRRVGSSRHQKRVSALHCWSTRDESPYAPQPCTSVQRSGHCVFVGTITGLLRHNRFRQSGLFDLIILGHLGQASQADMYAA